MFPSRRADPGTYARRERSSGPLAATDCELMRLDISIGLDDELSELDQARLARHLERCDPCAQFAHSLAGFTEVLRSDWIPSAPG